jgi:hypothetical protein
MTDFSKEAHVKKTVIEHICVQCNQPIHIGSPAVKGCCAEGSYFSFWYTHVECEEVAGSLAQISGCWGDEHTLLRDWDYTPEDRKWLLREYPIVAERLGVI